MDIETSQRLGFLLNQDDHAGGHEASIVIRTKTVWYMAGVVNVLVKIVRSFDRGEEMITGCDPHLYQVFQNGVERYTQSQLDWALEHGGGHAGEGASIMTFRVIEDLVRVEQSMLHWLESHKNLKL